MIRLLDSVLPLRCQGNQFLTPSTEKSATISSLEEFDTTILDPQDKRATQHEGPQESQRLAELQLNHEPGTTNQEPRSLPLFMTERISPW